MDRSETYIKMSDCPEIQKERAWGDGEYVAYHPEYYTDNGLTPDREKWDTGCLCEAGHEPKEWAWLPRQDQLQEMVFSIIPKTALDKFGLIAFMQFASEEMDGANSMEQLWMAFVMKEVYNKVWNGEEWE